MKIIVSLIVANVIMLPFLSGVCLGFENKKELQEFILEKNISTLSHVKLFENNIDAEDQYGRTMLMLMSGGGFVEAVKFILKNNPQIDKQDVSGWSALMYAVDINTIDIVKLLLDHGCNLNLKNASGQTALIMSTSDNYTSIFDLLVSNSANLEIFDEQGYNALMISVIRNNLPLVEKIIKLGVGINTYDSRQGYQGKTALIHASWYDVSLDILETLLAHGANVDHRTRDMQTALFYAVRSGSLPKVDVLISAGAEVDIRDKFGKSPCNYSKNNLIKDRLANCSTTE